jgi:YD repeat-containing protein
MKKKDRKNNNEKTNNKEYISRKDFLQNVAKHALTGSVILASLLKTENLYSFINHPEYSKFYSRSSCNPGPDCHTMPSGGENVGNNHDLKTNKPDPVNARTGNYLMNITDFIIPGIMLDLKFTRAYNSRLNYRGPFGNKWTHNYNHRLYDKGAYVDYFHGKGYIFRFKYSGKQYISPAGFNGTLTKNGSIYLLNIQNQIKLYFNEYGFFTKVVENNVNSIKINFDNEYKIKNIVDTRGRKILFEYDGVGRITKIILPDSRFYKYFYKDGKDNLTRVTDNHNNEALYVYDANHNMTSKYDSKMPAGFNEVAITYDGINRFKVMKDSYNNIIASAVYDENLNTFIDAGGNSWMYEFDNIGNLIKLSNNDRKITQYRYDSKRNLAQINYSNDEADNMDYTGFNLEPYTNGFWKHSWIYL